ncbi:allograft inflammatory factor 1-like [Mesoplodon densirostris]|uniref:allograft inflammatory factor 1-like n=1 Tax=Mesoplodon densirostris TaxID=48708 RepID=UPI0028DCF2D3|nr:allograft inflammatory factor 1-like [Mesoplodon densirostris]
MSEVEAVVRYGFHSNAFPTSLGSIRHMGWDWGDGSGRAAWTRRAPLPLVPLPRSRSPEPAEARCSPRRSVALSNRLQGGKALGLLKARQERRLAEINREFLCDQKYSDGENLPKKPAAFKEKYLEFDLNDEGKTDLMSLKRTMEKLGVPKTHLEMKKISEVAGGVSDTISYGDFVNMMPRKQSAVLKLLMMLEGKANESSPQPAGPPPEGHCLPAPRTPAPRTSARAGPAWRTPALPEDPCPRGPPPGPAPPPRSAPPS